MENVHFSRHSNCVHVTRFLRSLLPQLKRDTIYINTIQTETDDYCSFVACCGYHQIDQSGWIIGTAKTSHFEARIERKFENNFPSRGVKRSPFPVTKSFYYKLTNCEQSGSCCRPHNLISLKGSTLVDNLNHKMISRMKLINCLNRSTARLHKLITLQSFFVI